MEFKFTADIEFEAKDIDDAFGLLNKHFQNLVNDTDDEESGNWDDNWFVGEMNIEPKGA
jgi:hypothetical protein